MAPPPEYDKEPKAPDKSASNISCEESKALHNLVNDQQTNSDTKSTNAAASNEVENNKHVETLDDGQLRALLDEAITYKCPKDREGKSSLFKELLEEVEQDEQACEAAARGLSAGAAAARARRQTRSRRALPHSNSLQDLVAALAAEPAPRRRHHHAPHAQPAPVSTRAIHGGSLPSGVDTSFLLGEEPATRGAGYLATVRCVNPPPLAERRVSASDANPPDTDLLNRRSKPTFPMTYTARATLEIGSGSVCSGRAVTTTTASNQVRTRRLRHARPLAARTSRKPGSCAALEYPEFDARPERSGYDTQKSHDRPEFLTTQNPSDNRTQFSTDYFSDFARPPTCGPPERLYAKKLFIPKDKVIGKKVKKKKWNREDLALNAHELGVIKERYASEGIFVDDTPVIVSKDFNTSLTNKQKDVSSSKTPEDNQKRSEFEDSSITKNLDSTRLLNALIPKVNGDKNDGGGNKIVTEDLNSVEDKNKAEPRGPHTGNEYKTSDTSGKKPNEELSPRSQLQMNNVNSWYGGLNNYSSLNFDNPLYKALRGCNGNMVDKTGAKPCDFRKENREDDYIFPAISTKKEQNKKLCPQSDLWVSNGSNWYLENYSRENLSNSLARDDDTCEFNISKQYKSTSEKRYDKLYSQTDSATLKRNQRKIDSMKTQSYGIDYSLHKCKDCYRKPNFENENCRCGIGDINHAGINNDISYDDLCKLRKEYRQRIGKVLVAVDNPRNIRRMTVGQPLPEAINQKLCVTNVTDKIQRSNKDIDLIEDKKLSPEPVDKRTDISTFSSTNDNSGLVECEEDCEGDIPFNHSLRSSTPIPSDNATLHETIAIEEECLDDEQRVFHTKDMILMDNSKFEFKCEKEEPIRICDKIIRSQDEVQKNEIELVNLSPPKVEEFASCVEDVELLEISPRNPQGKCTTDDEIELKPITSSRFRDNSFSKYFAEQQKLLQALVYSDLNNEEHYSVSLLNNSEEVHKDDLEVIEDIVTSKSFEPLKHEAPIEVNELVETEKQPNSTQAGVINAIVLANEDRVLGNQCVLSELPNNAYVLLTLPQSLLMPLYHNTESQQLRIENNNDKPYIPGDNKSKSQKKREQSVSCSKKKETKNRNALRVLLFENLFKSDSADKSIGKEVSPVTDNEVDSAIPFSCITTPEVVASCNTTSSTSQAAVTVDPKPLQLQSGYRAVASLTGQPEVHPNLPPTGVRPDQPRSGISSSFNGLPLSRPNYGSTGSTAPEEFKKSLDENGNSVQGFSSPLSGSSQHKKPRRKKSSKNETVIKSHQIDGYQGNKDLNEVLRFIESNADNGRAQKLGRAKHKDDADDKGKKRSAERRKDKESKIKRATSMEELSRTKLEDLTDKPAKKERRADAAPAKAERRSWGDDARDSLYFRDDPEPPPDADFQTVTKKRKPRRRADEHERDPAAGEPPRAARTHSPARPRRVSAPPSDRSNDSNDDMDSVHSLPADATPARPQPVSYADIARTRHNIPDLIESCNFYAEGEPPRATEPLSAAPGDADGYPALEAPATAAAALRRSRPDRIDTKTAAQPTQRHNRKDRAEGGRATECPAPDVVADRRPPVILLDSAARPGDMDGVTFGFDINEQLLGGPARRPRCDLVRDAMEGGSEEVVAAAVASATAVAASVAASGVAVRAGCAALRYVAPTPPLDTLHLHQIIEYVGAAWEDVVRCGGGKVRYFSE